jgi:hypothetical protein
MEEIRYLISALTGPLAIAAVAGYIMYRFRQNLFEMVCSIGFLAALSGFIIGLESRYNMPAAIVMAASILALAIVRVFHKP